MESKSGILLIEARCKKYQRIVVENPIVGTTAVERGG